MPTAIYRLRGDDLAGLADLIVVRDEAGVDRRADGTDAPRRACRRRFDQREILAGLHAAPPEIDDPGGGQFGALGFELISEPT